jgi:hypothetical protein
MVTMTATDAAMMSLEKRCFMLGSAFIGERGYVAAKTAKAPVASSAGFDPQVYEVAHTRNGF